MICFSSIFCKILQKNQNMEIEIDYTFLKQNYIKNFDEMLKIIKRYYKVTLNIFYIINL